MKQKTFRVTINSDNKEIATMKIKKHFFLGTKRKIVSSRLLYKKKTKQNPSLYNQYEFIYKEGK